MSDFLLVLMTMAGIVYAAYFIYKNDGDGNALPDKTLMAMRPDPVARNKKRWSQRLRRHAPRGSEPDVNIGRGQ